MTTERENELIKKYYAWMIMYHQGNPLTMLKMKRLHDGPLHVSSYVPKVDTTVCGINNSIVVAHQSFLLAFEEAVENYIKNKPAIKKKYYERIEKNDLNEYLSKLDEETERKKKLFDAIFGESTEL